ncbi:flavin reductase [Aeromicrobium tamlense]|uniref:Flavin reductase n=1 Tax=Aeromicrobium tamlense TaxID=375541 RepID=A0A8I0FV35_9ACTN|nr:flavin reductase [Aeromicrobium tamlense]MBD1270756.1 flavin reductase [Aeromicrobium tamlense]MBD1271112.1 flavin reductase [Aeromicrobium tamlense]NYI38148.1 flavin reductase (DIM6/NTAB) family NADH-FMN oxidoreductase RutF/DNA-binding IclR family transcriptional regulator [Aeromicrobium tamlense]
MLTSAHQAPRQEPIESVEFRRVLGHYPSGVVAVTSVEDDGTPTGMIVSSFTSVSLDPPLVAFLPAKSSTTFQAIARRGAFCVNVLASHQEAVCRQLAAKGANKFDGLEWREGPSALPILEGAVAWIDCEIESKHDAGDHWIVVGRVLDLKVEDPAIPLLFFQGGYGRFAPLSISAVGAPDLVEQLRIVDQLHPGMAEASQRLGVEVLATARLEDELVAVATSGHPDPSRLPTRVGQRMPYVPPLGIVFAAWSDSEDWLRRGGLDEGQSGHVRRLVERVRSRGWSATTGTPSYSELERALARVSIHAPTPEQVRAVEEAIDPLGSDEPEDLVAGQAYAVRTVAVPVFDDAGAVRLALTAYGLPPTSTVDDITRYRDELKRLARSINLTAADLATVANN